jgi:HEPN domain-containing protein
VSESVERQPSNIITLREFIVEWQRQHERMHDEHVMSHAREHEMTGTAMVKAEQAVDRALNAALSSLNERLSNMNEFRASLSDASTRFATQQALVAMEKALREYIDQRANANAERIAALERSLGDRVDSRAAANAERIDRLEKTQANFAGRVWALGAAFGFVVILLQFVVPFLR